MPRESIVWEDGLYRLDASDTAATNNGQVD